MRFAHLRWRKYAVPSREFANATQVAAALLDARVAVLAGQQHIAMHTAPAAFVSEVARFCGSR